MTTQKFHSLNEHLQCVFLQFNIYPTIPSEKHHFLLLLKKSFFTLFLGKIFLQHAIIYGSGSKYIAPDGANFTLLTVTPSDNNLTGHISTVRQRVLYVSEYGKHKSQVALYANSSYRCWIVSNQRSGDFPKVKSKGIRFIVLYPPKRSHDLPPLAGTVHTETISIPLGIFQSNWQHIAHTL